jgi:phosphoglycolate phosphatase
LEDRGLRRDISSVLFDLDGTLIDSTEAILHSFHATYSHYEEVSPSREKIESLIGYRLEDMFEILGTGGASPSEYADIYRQNYRKVHIDKTILLPGVEKAVEKIASFAPVAIVTTKTGLFSRELLEHFGIMKYIETVVGSEDVQRHKPHPEPIFEALERLGVGTDGSWMIGDTCMDIDAAKNASIDSIAVTCGYGDMEVLRKCTSNIVKNVPEAVNLIIDG